MYGAYVQIPVTCSSSEVFDLIVDLAQEQRVDGTRMRIQGTATRNDIPCDQATHTYTATIVPLFGKFQSGRATVRARVGGQQSWVEPEEVSRRVRLFPDLL